MIEFVNCQHVKGQCNAVGLKSMLLWTGQRKLKQWLEDIYSVIAALQDRIGLSVMGDGTLMNLAHKYRNTNTEVACILLV